MRDTDFHFLRVFLVAINCQHAVFTACFTRYCEQRNNTARPPPPPSRPYPPLPDCNVMPLSCCSNCSTTFRYTDYCMMLPLFGRWNSKLASLPLRLPLSSPPLPPPPPLPPQTSYPRPCPRSSVPAISWPTSTSLSTRMTMYARLRGKGRG